VSWTQCSRAFIRHDCLLRHLRTKHRLDHKALLVTNLIYLCLRFLFEIYSSWLLFQTENMMELLSLLVESNALRNFGWPECSVDQVLQKAVIQCGEEAASSPSIPLTWRCIHIYLTWAQRLKANTKTPFSFIVDDQAALENWFAWRSIEQVLKQVISLAKSSDYVDLVDRGLSMHKPTDIRRAVINFLFI